MPLALFYLTTLKAPYGAGIDNFKEGKAILIPDGYSTITLTKRIDA